jgi:hypothetical protein
MRKVMFLAAACLVAAGSSAELVKLKWETPLDFRGNATAYMAIDALYALPLGSRASVVLTRVDDVDPRRTLIYANLNSTGAVSAMEPLTPEGIGNDRVRASAIDTTGRLYLATGEPSANSSLWFRISQTGTILLNRVRPFDYSALLVDPYGTAYGVAAPGGSGIFKLDPYATLKWGISFPSGVESGVNRMFLDSQGNLNLIASGHVSQFGYKTSFMRRISPTGTLLSHVPLALGDKETIVEAARDKDGNYIAVVRNSEPDPHYYTSIRKFRSSDGTQLWSVDLGFRVDPEMAVDGQGRTWVIRRTGDNMGQLQQLSKVGSVNWTHTFDDISPFQLHLDINDESYVAGITGDNRTILYKHAGNGYNRFSYTMSTPDGRRFPSALSVENESGNIFVGSLSRPAGEKDLAVISCLMQAPYVRNDAYNVPAHQATTVGPIVANDSYKQNAQLTIIRQPANGTLTSVGQDGRTTYQPNAGFTGTDSFTYRLSRSNLVSYTATVTLNVQ